MKTPIKTTLQALAGAALLVLAQPQANAVVFGFTQISTNTNTTVASQFSVDVTAFDADTVSFAFTNTGSIASSIAEIYFDDGLFGAISIVNSAGVNFVLGASPADLPGGNAVNFTATTAVNSEASSPAPSNGINPGETLTLRIDVGGYNDFATVISKLQNPDANGDIRIGLHVTGIAGGGSDAFVSGGGRSVPDGGATLALLGSVLAGVGVFRRYVKFN
ncbi:MAG TPA: VPDSG-CTERM sorting domain-containing protein [Candidatus Kapabacteria bacterium]|jgi:hypothetical protein|nr:VPDSG-CTERM sorting domain-containing protein [Candidatus Kapabacteria bacterium]